MIGLPRVGRLRAHIGVQYSQIELGYGNGVGLKAVICFIAFLYFDGVINEFEKDFKEAMNRNRVTSERGWQSC